jgi:hypothetical protein
MDLETQVMGDGSLRISLARPRSEHFNHYNAINAPVVFGVAEVAGAGAIVIGLGEAFVRAYTVVESAGIAYRAPARSGVVAVARLAGDHAAVVRAKVEQGGAQVVDVCVELSDLNGRSTGESRFRIAPRPRRST